MRRPSPLTLGAILEISPEKLVAGGDSLTRIEGYPLFVRGIYPGDRATVRVTEVKKGFARGDLVAVIAPGPLRRAAPCPVAEQCGGCDWTALQLDHQLRAKRDILLETIRRIGKIDVESLPPLRVHPSPLNYRLRSRLQYDVRHDRLGFFALQSHDVVEISDVCEVVGPQTLASLDEIREVARRSGADSISVFEEQHERGAGALARPGETLPKSSLEARSNVPQLRHDPGSVSGRAGEGARPPMDGRDVVITAAGYRYLTSTAAFFQVNRHLLGRLLELVRSRASASPERSSALDLYGGVGFFALPLGDLFDRVVSVEGSALAHHYARINLAAREEGGLEARRPSFEAVNASVEQYVNETIEQFDLVMLDPPRAGAAPGVMEQIDRLARHTVCYLSCDPVTFARDAARLMRHGWSISTLDLVDLFPNTHHIETLASFRRDRKD